MERVRAEGGADVILDIMGAAYLDRNVDALATEGRMVIIGMQGGVKAELNLGKLLVKRAGVIATTLRSRPVTGRGGKSEIVAEVVENVWPMIADGQSAADHRRRVPHRAGQGGTRAAGVWRGIRENRSARWRLADVSQSDAKDASARTS